MKQITLNELPVNGEQHMKIAPETGINENQCLQITQILNPLLANTYHLLLQTQQCHWNITGSNFIAIHGLTEQHYNNMFQAIDEIAERIRMLDLYPVASLSELSSLSNLDDPSALLHWKEHLSLLLKGHRHLINLCRKAIDVAQNCKDEGTVELVTGRLRFHEKAAWMIRSQLSV